MKHVLCALLAIGAYLFLVFLGIAGFAAAIWIIAKVLLWLGVFR